MATTSLGVPVDEAFSCLPTPIPSAGDVPDQALMMPPIGTHWDNVACHDAAKIQLYNASITPATAAALVKVLGLVDVADLRMLTLAQISDLNLPIMEQRRLEHLASLSSARLCSRLSNLANRLDAAQPGAIIDLEGSVVSGDAGDSGAFTITQHNVTLRNGTLKLSGGQHIAIACSGITFERINVVHAADPAAKAVASAAIAVRGPCCALVLKRCALTSNQCDTLVCVADGGCVKMDECELRGASGVVAMSLEGAAQLKATGTTFSGCGRLLAVQSGSMADLSTCKLDGSSDPTACAVVTDAGSNLLATGCTWSSNAGEGLLVSSGGAATLHSCALHGSRGRGGATVTGHGSALNATTTTFKDNMQHGVAALAAARTTLEACTFSGNLMAAGLVVAGAGTVVLAKLTTVGSERGSAARVANGATVQMDSCTLSGAEKGVGLEVTGGGGDGGGGSAAAADGGSGSVVVRDGSLCGAKNGGVGVDGGATVLLHRVNVSGTKYLGLVRGPGSRLEVVGSTGLGGAYKVSEAGVLVGAKTSTPLFSWA